MVTLVMLASAGDANAFGELVKRFQDMAVGYAYGLVHDRHAAEDAAQDAFLDAWRLIGRLRKPAGFPAWLRRIVFKHSDRRLRRRPKVVALEVDVAAQGSDGEAMRRQMEQAVQALPDHERDVVALYYFADHSVADIARFLDLSESATKSRLHSARQRLREGIMAMAEKDLESVQRPSQSGTFVEKVMRMIKPAELQSDHPHGAWSCRGSDVWDMICAAIMGNADRIRRLIERDPNLYRAEYWYTQPIHFAVREGHVDAVRALLDAGADPNVIRYGGEDLVTVARDRGHEPVAALLEQARAKQTNAQTAEHLIHIAAADGDLEQLRRLLDVDLSLVRRGDREGATPLHRAVAGGKREAVELLLDRGADVDAVQSAGGTYAAGGFRPIDLALWTGPFWGVRGDVEMVRLLLSRGASYSMTIAAALGDMDRVRTLLNDAPASVNEAQPSGKRPLSAAIEFGHSALARLLLERGADPSLSEGAMAPRGAALHVAASRGDREMVELLLARGADPNSGIDSAGSATYGAKTKELRGLLMARGGLLDAYDLVWLGEDQELLRRAAADPAWAATSGCGGVFTAVCDQGRRDLLPRLLDLGVRVPSSVTGCRTYLLTHADMLTTLLERGGMDPNLPNWQRTTPLHDTCGRDGRGRALANRVEIATVLLDHGADMNARDEEYRSTPLAWAARNDLPDMAEFLLARGAKVSLPDDEPWATPLAWAQRRGHDAITALLRQRSAT
jgi:RNA polymerase sigma factor (sigma-70 family)